MTGDGRRQRKNRRNEKPPPDTKKQSHVRQARQNAPQVQADSGPMADMLKRKLLGKKD